MNKIIAHRGAAAYAPENTFAAFDRAFALGCGMIEFDVMLSADGVLFVIHDPALKRTTNGHGTVHTTSAETLRNLDAGRWFDRAFSGEKIPQFQDVLYWLQFTNMRANIEIKATLGMEQATVIAVLSAITQHWSSAQNMLLFSSFDIEILRLCRKLAPEVSLGLLMDKWSENWIYIASELNCYSVHLSKALVTLLRVNAIKEEGYAVLVYTVNSASLAKKFFEWGVDAIFTDYPDLDYSSDCAKSARVGC